MFCQAMMSRRLVVPSTGFFEWKHAEGKKQKEKYWFRLHGSHVLYMAGLYTEYKQPDSSVEKRFVILTTGANPCMADIHDRMLVILLGDQIGEWAKDMDVSLEILHKTPPAFEKMVA